MCADSGSCDSVMPLKGFEHSKVWPSKQSERGLSYEVANKQTIPNLGERRLLMWTEGADAPKGFAIQVADVHKPLLSLSRCADLGSESRFGQSAGALIDTATGEMIPLRRRGNLYTLRAWVRAAPIEMTHFGGTRQPVRRDPHCQKSCKT